MTFREIIEGEDQNTDSIWMYREGLFMKAYERSAFFAHTLIHEFKLSKRYIKTVNMDVISLGFPEQTIPKWFNGYVYEWVQDGLLRCHMRKAFDEVEFHHSDLMTQVFNLLSIIYIKVNNLIFTRRSINRYSTERYQIYKGTIRWIVPTF